MSWTYSPCPVVGDAYGPNKRVCPQIGNSQIQALFHPWFWKSWSHLKLRLLGYPHFQTHSKWHLLGLYPHISPINSCNFTQSPINLQLISWLFRGLPSAAMAWGVCFTARRMYPGHDCPTRAARGVRVPLQERVIDTIDTRKSSKMWFTKSGTCL
jgi:hypothetical protein